MWHHQGVTLPSNNLKRRCVGPHFSAVELRTTVPKRAGPDRAAKRYPSCQDSQVQLFQKQALLHLENSIG